MTDTNHAALDPTGHFLLEMPLSKADDAASALSAIGVSFVPRNAVMGFTDRQGVAPNHTGLNIADVVVAINLHLRETDQSHRLREMIGAMTLADRHAILTFATQCCDWTDGEPSYVAGIDPGSWEDFQRDNPDLIASF